MHVLFVPLHSRNDAGDVDESKTILVETIGPILIALWLFSWDSCPVHVATKQLCTYPLSFIIRHPQLNPTGGNNSRHMEKSENILVAKIGQILVALLLFLWGLSTHEEVGFQMPIDCHLKNVNRLLNSQNDRGDIEESEIILVEAFGQLMVELF